jgi:hypothetical protein
MVTLPRRGVVQTEITNLHQPKHPQVRQYACILLACKFHDPLASFDLNFLRKTREMSMVSKTLGEDAIWPHKLEFECLDGGRE